MMQIARGWRVAVAGLAVGVVGVLGFACPVASAEPGFPPRPARVSAGSRGRRFAWLRTRYMFECRFNRREAAL